MFGGDVCPISNVKTEPCRLGPEHLAGASARSPHQKNPLNYLFEISPPIFLFFSWKGCFLGGDDYCPGSRGVGASPSRQSRRAAHTTTPHRPLIHNLAKHRRSYSDSPENLWVAFYFWAPLFFLWITYLCWRQALLARGRYIYRLPQSTRNWQHSRRSLNGSGGLFLSSV